MLTDQGSTTSSSSDVLTVTTASSWCAIPASSRIRVLRLIRPHTRRMLVAAPDCHPSYGFAVRGGKEFGTGFFVSNVERSSEADLKGLRIGDQILRINGFRVEDAIHKEFIQFVTSQDRITLKVRGVGMLPIKDNEQDRLSWHVVKVASVSCTPSECSYRTKSSTLENDNRNKEINVVLNVAPRTKLGLGICKGPEWKPGIFVQFTKDKSVAREAGLRPGDQILSVNSIDFSDVLFSEAVAVMKSSNKLEMVVRTGAGCDLFPGESSGYNSSASSVTGDQSPCWADAKSKRLTAVREEMPNGAGWSEANALYAEAAQRSNRFATDKKDNVNGAGMPNREVNKTIIKLSESGTSINNTYIANPKMSPTASLSPTPPLLSSSSSPSQDSAARRSVISATGNTVLPPPPPPVNINMQFAKNNNHHNNNNNYGSQTTTSNHNIYVIKSTATTVGAITDPSAAAAPAAPTDTIAKAGSAKTPSANAKAASCLNSAGRASAANGGGSISGNCGTDTCNKGTNSHRSHSVNTALGVCGIVGGSSLSSAISEELKKRKEKQRIAAAMAAAANGGTPVTNACNNKRPNHCANSNNNDHNKLSHSNSITANDQLVSPRGRAHGTVTGTGNGTTTPAGGDQHSALMDEFMSFHQRMFKNGFHESEQERQEALNRTSIMEDDVNHRKCQNLNTTAPQVENTPLNGAEHASQSSQHLPLPPPPPPFANAPTCANQQLSPALHKTSQKSYAYTSEHPRPPSTPVPDYDVVQFRTNISRSGNNGVYANQKILTQSVRDSTAATATKMPSGHTAAANNRYSARPAGAVTIGQYEHQRKEPAKFDFISPNKRSVNGSNEQSDSQHAQSLHSELQNTLSRSNLKKSSGAMEHQSHCPLKNAHYEQYESKNYANLEVVTRKMQDARIANGTKNGDGAVKVNGTGTGILKNGSRSRTSSMTKNTEKSIKFGN